MARRDVLGRSGARLGPRTGAGADSAHGARAMAAGVVVALRPLGHRTPAGGQLASTRSSHSPCRAQGAARHLPRGFDGPALALYRDGRDALGAHRDRELRYTENTLIGILTFGARRPWVLAPRDRGSGREPVDLAPGPGDLLVVGGGRSGNGCTASPRRPGCVPRVSVQWRWTSGTGRPEIGPGHRAPRRFGSG